MSFGDCMTAKIWLRDVAKEVESIGLLGKPIAQYEFNELLKHPRYRHVHPLIRQGRDKRPGSRVPDPGWFGWVLSCIFRKHAEQVNADARVMRLEGYEVIQTHETRVSNAGNDYEVNLYTFRRTADVSTDVAMVDALLEEIGRSPSVHLRR